jgi:Predicted transcriptional regulators
MNLEKLTVGQMAKLNHISEQTLRLYDRMDVLTPQTINEDNGYRYYTIGQSAQLDTIRYYQKIGFSLNDIKTKLMVPNIDLINHQLQLRLKELTEEIAHLEKCEKAIAKNLSNYNYFQSLPKNNSTFIEYLPQYHIMVYDTGENMYDFDYNHYEYNLRRFKNYLEDIHFDGSLFGNIGTIVRNESLTKHHLVSTELFIMSDSEATNYPKTEIIQEGTYLSMCCTNFSKEKTYLSALLHEANVLGLSVSGDYFCEVLSEYPDLISKNRCFYYKIRIKVSF